MTTSGQAEEVPFLSGFEREPPKPGWQDVSVTVERIGRKVCTMLNTRGPEDYEKNERDLQSLIFEAVKLGAQNGGYHEAPKGGDSSTKTVVLGVGITLLGAFIIGGWAVSNRVAALEARFTEWQSAITQRQNAQDQRIDRLENRRQ